CFRSPTPPTGWSPLLIAVTGPGEQTATNQLVVLDSGSKQVVSAVVPFNLTAPFPTPRVFGTNYASNGFLNALNVSTGNLDGYTNGDDPAHGSANTNPDHPNVYIAVAPDAGGGPVVKIYR